MNTTRYAGLNSPLYFYNSTIRKFLKFEYPNYHLDKLVPQS